MPTGRETWTPALQAWIRDHRYLLLGLGWLVTLAAGVIGFATLHRTPLPGHEPPLPATWDNAFYRATQLFTMESGDPGDEVALNLALRFARFAAMAIALSTAAVAVGLLFREQVGLLRLRWSRRHDVVLGLGEDGASLVHDLLDRGIRTVVLEPDPQHPAVAAVRGRGAIVLAGDPRTTGDLDRLRLARVERVFVTTGDDGGNVDAALEAVRRLGPVPDDARGADRVFVHVSDSLLREALCAITESWPPSDRRFRIIDPAARVARLFFDRLPPDAMLHRVQDSRRVRLVIAGSGAIASALVRRAGLTCHYANGRRTRVTLCDAGADAARARMVRAHHGIEGLIDFDAADLDAGPAALPGLVEDALADRDAATAFVLCVEEPREAVVLATHLARFLRGRAWLAVHVPDPRGFGRLLSSGPIAGTELRAFGDGDSVSPLDAICDDALDRLARAMHDHYRVQRLRLGWPENPVADVPWEDLPESYRDANRHSADHIAVKLRAIGAVAMDEGAPATEGVADFAFTGDEVEVLSRMEHLRWCADRVLKGWTWAKERDDARRLHPSLIPWAELDEVERDKDRSTVRNIPELMRMAGRRIVRV